MVIGVAFKYEVFNFIHIVSGVTKVFMPSKRLINYLRRFENRRKKWNLFPNDSDLERLRRCEKGYYGLMFTQFFIISRMLASDTMGVPVYMKIALGCWFVYVLFDYYWVSKSIDLFVSRSESNITSLLDVTERDTQY